MSQLRNITMAIILYANDHDDTLPPDLDVLVENRYVYSKEMFVDPVTGLEYVYVGGPNLSKGAPSLILVHENPTDRKTVRAAHFDGSVRAYTIEEFNRAIKKTYDANEGK